MRDATLVGYSMGGGEVVRYLATYGTDRVARAVLAATALPYRYKTDDNPDGDADDALIAQFEDVLKKDRLAFLEGFLQTWFGSGPHADIHEARCSYAFQIAAHASPKAMLDSIASILRTDFRADLEKRALSSTPAGSHRRELRAEPRGNRVERLAWAVCPP